MSSLTAQQVHAKMIDKARASGLSAEDATLLGFTPYPARAAHDAKLVPVAGAGFTLPYFDLHKRKTKFYRYRYLEDTRKGFDTLTGKKPLRYSQPAGTPVELYMCPLAEWASIAQDPEHLIVITEGELKAACVTKYGYPTLGLGGVWSFQSAKAGEPLLPAFDAFDLKGRAVVIVFDSDAATNPDVVAAEQRLAKRLTERGAHVRIARVPNTELAKTGVDDYIMLYGIEEFAEQVLSNAFAYSGSEVLHQLNSEVVYVREPECIWEFRDARRMSVGTFRDSAYANRFFTERVETKTGFGLKKVKAAARWIEWEHRAEVRGVTFRPGAERITEDGLLNMWDGWGLKAPRRDPEDAKPWGWLMDRIFDGDAEARRYFEAWCAYPLQHPGAKMSVAAALWGPIQGSGKTQVGHTLMRLYGKKHSLELKDTQLDDEHNRWAEGVQFALADDITARGDRRFMRRLMTMITQHHMMIDPKFITPFTIEDRINYLFTSNDPDALYMDDHDRRFFVHEVTGAPMSKSEAAQYTAWRDSDFRLSALWGYLLDLDLGDFDPQAPAPLTSSKASMVRMGKSDLGEWVRDLRENAPTVLRRAGYKGDLFNSKELMQLYDPTGDKRTSLNALARELKRAGFNPPANGTSIRCPDGSMTMVYAVLNGGDWKNRSWSEASTHYADNRPKHTWDKKL